MKKQVNETFQALERPFALHLLCYLNDFNRPLKTSEIDKEFNLLKKQTVAKRLNELSQVSLIRMTSESEKDYPNKYWEITEKGSKFCEAVKKFMRE